MIKIFFRVVTMVCLLGGAVAVSASSGYMRCQGDIVDAGTYRAEVIAKCGQPDAAERNRLYYSDGSVMRIVHFHGAKVSRIETERR